MVGGNCWKCLWCSSIVSASCIGWPVLDPSLSTALYDQKCRANRTKSLLLFTSVDCYKHSCHSGFKGQIIFLTTQCKITPEGLVMHQESWDMFPEIRVSDTRNFALQFTSYEIKTLWYFIYTGFSWRQNDYMKLGAMKTSFPIIPALWEVLSPLQIPHCGDKSNYCPVLCGYMSYDVVLYNIPNMQPI